MTSLLCVLLMHSFVARAAPLQGLTSIREGGNGQTNKGEQPRDRSIFTVISMACMMMVAFLLGSRSGKLRRSIMLKRSLMSTLVLILYILVLMFIMSSAILVIGQGLYTRALCVAGTWTCLVFYTSIKGIIYVFLVERIHVVRAPFVNRKNDRIYLGCMAMIIVTYSIVAANTWVNHVTELRASDGRCHFGIRGIGSIPFTVVNFTTNGILTAVFFYLLRPVSQKPVSAGFSTALGGSDTDTVTGHGGSDTMVRKNIRNLIWKSVVGSLLVEIPTAANMIQFAVTRGEELGMISLTICLVDACWDAVIIHWLTSSCSSEEATEGELSRSMLSSSKDSLSPIPSRAPSQSNGSGGPRISITRGTDGSQDTLISAMDFLCESAMHSTSSLVRPARAKL
ncbi:hypothetical protein Alg130_09537 [Pyrenophora tritici-repentis]|nr:hypothetical protein Alg130_09537 [Pyrenophora tritici-repentis]